MTIHERPRGHDWQNWETCNCGEPGCRSYRGRGDQPMPAPVFAIGQRITITTSIGVYRQIVTAVHSDCHGRITYTTQRAEEGL